MILSLQDKYDFTTCRKLFDLLVTHGAKTDGVGAVIISMIYCCAKILKAEPINCKRETERA